MLLRPACEHESTDITELMRKSKAYWGYSAEQICKWHDELTMTVEYIKKHHVCVAVEDSELCGMCSFSSCSQTKVVLDNLFVEPSRIGSGVGSALLEYCIDFAVKSSASSIVLNADPNAQDFYLHHGFSVIGKKPNSIQGRYLPIMSKTLKVH